MIRRFRFKSLATVSTMAFLFLFAGAGAVSALDPGPCAEDLKEYCSGITPGGGRLIQCLNEHSEELSSSCENWIERIKEKSQELNEACFEEIVHFCNFEEPDLVRIVSCLQERYVNLTLACRQKLREFKKR